MSVGSFSSSFNFRYYKGFVLIIDPIDDSEITYTNAIKRFS